MATEMRPVRRVSGRLAAVAESATLAVDAKAKAIAAGGEKVWSFGAGEPDFPTPDHIVEAAAAACRELANHKYTATPGLPELREAIANRAALDFGLTTPASQVIVTNGAKQAVFNSFAALCDPGDEVIIPAPYWTTYPEAVALAGGVPVAVETEESSGFRVCVDQLEAARTDRTKALMFVSPSNPTGAVYGREQMEAIGRWAADKGIWVVTDEIYAKLVFGSAEHHSMPVLVPELADRTIVISGVSKSYAMTGWRVGWMIGPPDLIQAVCNFQSHATSNVSNVAQRAAIAGLTGDQGPVEEMRLAFDRRRKFAVEAVRAMAGVTCADPEGAFYVFPNLTGALAGDFDGATASTTLELAELILEKARVAIVPGEAFGAPGYARLSYAMSDDDLGEGLDRLAQFLSTAK